MNLTSETFNGVLNESKVLIVDFWADWCSPCKKIAPILDEIAKEYKITIAKVNVDEQVDLAYKYDISTIPTLLVFENGLPVKRVVGAQPKHKLVKEFEGWI